jgi:hypothetical protein
MAHKSLSNLLLDEKSFVPPDDENHPLLARGAD